MSASDYSRCQAPGGRGPGDLLNVLKSTEIRTRLIESGATFPANGNVASALEPGDLDAIQAEAEGHVAALLDTLLIARDHNTEDTPARVAKMLVREVFGGRYLPRPDVTDFPNVSKLDQIYVVGPIAVRSCCAHHLVPILGQAWVGVVPSERVIGLSKFHRLAEWVMARPTIQEEATQQLADVIEHAVRPRALGVVVRAKHLCCAWRGVRDEPSLMTTSVMRGLFKTDGDARREFLALIRGQGFA